MENEVEWTGKAEIRNVAECRVAGEACKVISGLLPALKEKSSPGDTVRLTGK